MSKIRWVSMLGGIMISGILFAGCAEAPAEVLEELNALTTQDEVAENKSDFKDLVYIPVSALKEENAEYREEQIGNLIFSGSVTTPDTEVLYELRLEPYAGFYENRESVVPRLLTWYDLPSENWEDAVVFHINRDENIFIGDEALAGFVPFLEIQTGDITLQIGAEGVLVMVNGDFDTEEHFWYELKTPNDYRIWNLVVGQIPEEVILNESVTLEELYQDFIEITDLYNELGAGLNFKPSTAAYYDTESGCMASLEARQTYKGVFFDPTNVQNQKMEAQGGKTYLRTGIRAKYHCAQDRCLISLYNSYLPVEELETYEEVIGFETALRLLQERLGDNYTAHIEEADFFYQCYYYGEYGNIWDGYEKEVITAYAHPCWRFVESIGDETPLTRTVYYVDAISGEVMCFYECCQLY